MEQYHQLLREILVNGEVQYEPRTEEYILGLAGFQSLYDLRGSFPLVTTKNIVSRLVFEELFWKLRGERNVKSLFDRNIHIWDDNAFQHYLKRHNLTSEFPKHSEKWEEGFIKYKEKIANNPEFAAIEGDMGPVYGYQLRHSKKQNGEEIDQLKNLLKGIKEKPGSRYHVMSAWDVGELSEMAIGPCPFWHQFTVYDDNVDLHTVQRSADTYLGVPFNIAQESLLAYMIAKETGLKPRKFIHTCINTHIYLGVSPRADFWRDEKNVRVFQSMAKDGDYLGLRDWYLKSAPPESKINERKDHIPFVLEQLSKAPKELPSIKLEDISLFDAIQHPVGEIVSVENYNPHEWDSKARVAG
mgnify:CR=1 FL=1